VNALLMVSSIEYNSSFWSNKEFICNEVLAKEIAFGTLNRASALNAELEEGETFIALVKS
jgi:hypothetical protein